MQPNPPEMIYCKGDRIQGLAIIGDKSHHDQRGYFKPAFRQLRDGMFMNQTLWQGQMPTISEINISYSKTGVVRGLHTMKRNPQVKAVNVADGCIYDLIVDLRPDSNTYLSANAFKISSLTSGLLIPAGCAHGFVSIVDSVVVYGTSSPYNPEDDGGVRWDDPSFGFQNLIKPSIISDKDMKLPTLQEYLKQSE